MKTTFFKSLIPLLRLINICLYHYIIKDLYEIKYSNIKRDIPHHTYQNHCLQ